MLSDFTKACVYIAFKARAPGFEGNVGSNSTVLVLALRFRKQLRGKRDGLKGLENFRATAHALYPAHRAA